MGSSFCRKPTVLGMGAFQSERGGLAEGGMFRPTPKVEKPLSMGREQGTGGGNYK